MTPLRVGIVGCGNISAQYLDTFSRLDTVELVAVADLVPERAAAVAAGVPGARALGIDELLADPQVQLVVNLTIPAAHADVSLRALAAGKEVYTEKPLTADSASAAQVMDAAAAAGLWVGCAPDTVLGTGIQTARKAVDDGLIGRPISATATMITSGHERWHPNPDFYYLPGGGPLLDMGPYYVSALIQLLGPVASVTGVASRLRDERVIGSGPRAGERIPVEVDTHVTGVLTHASGALSTLVMSFDAVATRASNIEVHGESGSLVVPDPNNFDGEVLLNILGGDGWTALPVSAGYPHAGRGIGIHDRALVGPTEARASGALGQHALDVMLSVLRSADEGGTLHLTTTCERPSAVPLSPAEEYA
ncbi:MULTISPECIES: Gfo/Idh/MocA family protein [unclassified Microbacterium]|uniref:Gfo/Idh/MocA family protein n=1 Tax=unclassified Microbacterium TaxID=2609290 RepID=UPI0012F87CF0|nr:Gfo/Idh/MocA family oxidoreductase [Microbacterium sp. MAH-37]